MKDFVLCCLWNLFQVFLLGGVCCVLWNFIIAPHSGLPLFNYAVFVGGYLGVKALTIPLVTEANLTTKKNTREQEVSKIDD